MVAPADREATNAANRIDISLLSHTNVGKTTLARTLLREDIGEVGDRAHVTEVAESHVLIDSEGGDALLLWDTPGFGDSVRVLKRLQSSDKPIGWFLTHVWDRFADRPFWCSQQALRTARDRSDVILYVVNAGEQPSAATYIDAEMRILGWLGKPVILLLNQLGPPMEREDAATEVSGWQQHITAFPWIESILPFDAFARCWVQEGTLLAHIQPLLPAGKRSAFETLRLLWRERNLAVFKESMQALATQVAATAIDSEPIQELDIRGKARAWLGAVRAGERTDAELEHAQTALASRLDGRVRQTTENLVRLHGLTGRATAEVLQRLGTQFAVDRPADADKASVLGGLVSGALGGLAADLAAGGLTFGAGALLGGVLGAFGARGLAKAYNLARGTNTGSVRWSTEFLFGRVAAALLRYLLVAHFGRGRGEFVTSGVPAHWPAVVNRALERRRREFESVLQSAQPDREEPAGPLFDSHALAVKLTSPITASAQEVLVSLYPDVANVFW